MIAACEAQVRNLPQFFERVVGLISAGPGGDTAHYLTDLVVGGSGGQPNSAAFFNECIGNLFRPCFAPDGGQSRAPVFNFDTEAPILWGFGGIPSATTTSRQQTDQRPPPPATPSHALWAPPPPYAAQRWTDQPRGASAPPTTANTNSSQGQLLLTEAYPRRPSSATIIGPNLASTTGLQGPPTACPICQAPAPHAPYLQHRAFECPVNYHRRLVEPCPGFNEAGYRLPSAWTGDDITAETAEQWKRYIEKYNLPRSKMELERRVSAFPSVAETPPAAARPQQKRYINFHN